MKKVVKYNPPTPQIDGRCPECGWMNLDYGDTVIEAQSLGYEFECMDCHAKGTEWYNLDFDEFSIDEHGETYGK